MPFETKGQKKSLWEQMGRKVPSMVSDDMMLKKKEPEAPVEEPKKKGKPLWEQMGRKY